MRARAVVFVVLGLTGCDQVFSLHRSTRDGATGDGAVTDGAPGVCVTPALTEPFDGTTACDGWGYRGGSNSMMTQGNGKLRISVAAGVIGDASCTAMMASGFADGAFVEVAGISRLESSYTFLAIDWAGGSQKRIILASDGMLWLRDQADTQFASEPYDPESMRWWRLRPATDAIIAEYSADGRTWRTLGTSPVSGVPASVRINLNAGTYDTTHAQSWYAEFEGLNVCPP